MQAFAFGLRESAAPSLDESRSRYAPSSIYSGHGPVEDYPMPGRHSNMRNGQGGAVISGKTESRYIPRYSKKERPHTASTLDTNDPVAMHLLMETAIIDSKDFEILSFEELEHLKKEKTFLRGKIDGTKRQLTLENKMRDAAQSLNRLYPGERDNLNSHRNSMDELSASNLKIEELGNELANYESRLEYVDQRILQHTAGILQLTHRGLKKNIRKNELPRSPESMASRSHRSMSQDGVNEFDERSLYQVPDYVHEFNKSSSAFNGSSTTDKERQAINSAANRLHELSDRLYEMLQHENSAEYMSSPPDVNANGDSAQSLSQLETLVEYLENGLEAVALVHETSKANAQEEQLAGLSSKLNNILQRTDAIKQSPALAQEEQRGTDMKSQLELADSALDRLNSRVGTLLEQKDILTRQIQQQRDVNSRADAQRDAHIRELSQELSALKQSQDLSDRELQQSSNQISLLMEELDRAKQAHVLLEQQRELNDNKAVQVERDAKSKVENELQAKHLAYTQLQAEKSRVESELQTKQSAYTQLHAEKSRFESELQAKHSAYNQLHAEKSRFESDLQAKQSAHTQLQADHGRMQGDMQKLESQIVQLQTELTMVKAELDGAYGTRAQRAADVSMNPAVRKEIDDLNARNGALQRELKATIEDYEQMTKSGIESEKERDHLEATLDSMRDRCEFLEAQINDEKVKWLGIKTSLPPENTSTMVLKNEFKKMMRESRADSIKAIKAEQEERRRLESVIRSMKREMNLQPTSKQQMRSPVITESANPA